MLLDKTQIGDSENIGIQAKNKIDDSGIICICLQKNAQN